MKLRKIFLTILFVGISLSLGANVFAVGLGGSGISVTCKNNLPQSLKTASCVCASDMKTCVSEKNQAFYCSTICSGDYKELGEEEELDDYTPEPTKYCVEDFTMIFGQEKDCVCPSGTILCEEVVSSTVSKYTCRDKCSEGTPVTGGEVAVNPGDSSSHSSGTGWDSDWTDEYSNSVSNVSDTEGMHTGATELENPVKWGTFSELIDAIATWLLTIGLVLAPLMFVIGGIMFATAYGNASKVQSAKNLMIYTGIGIGIILLAKTLVEVLKGFIG